MRTKSQIPTVPESELKGCMFVVLRLNQSVSFTNPVTKQDESVKLEGCHGYLPVYKSIIEAQEASCAGRFQIVAIQEVKES